MADIGVKGHDVHRRDARVAYKDKDQDVKNSLVFIITAYDYFILA